MRGNRINVTLKDELYRKVAGEAELLGVPLATMVSIALARYYNGQAVQQAVTAPVIEPVKEEQNTYSSIDMDIEIEDLD